MLTLSQHTSFLPIGLRAAIEAGEHCSVILVCKGSVQDSNTWMAQGGIASVLDETDAFESHIADTLSAGCGICDEGVVETVVRQGPELIRQLLDWGADFDKLDGRIATTLEGGHSHARVIHAHGDDNYRGAYKKGAGEPEDKDFGGLLRY